MNNGQLIDTLNKLDLRLTKLEEDIQLIVSKKIYSNYFKEQVRVLNSEYSNILLKIKKEFDKYDPKKQVHINKIILLALPEVPMDIETFFLLVNSKLSNLNIPFSLLEIEIFLYKLGFIQDRQISKKFVSEQTYEDYLRVV